MSIRDDRFLTLHFCQAVLLALAFLPVWQVSAREAAPVAVSVFGDGDPSNGIEDDRRPLFGETGRGITPAELRINAGTIFCDGKLRGSAVALDTRSYAPGLKGVVLSTAAHVIYDLDEKTLFTQCEFHYLALDQLSRYRAAIDMGRARLGGFDPARATSEPAFGRGDWAFLYVPAAWSGFDPGGNLEARDFSLTADAGFHRGGVRMRLVAFDGAAGAISISPHCTARLSRADDLGGGIWPGQLLDDCDSEQAASGGAIIAVSGDRQYLVGIRLGTHWSPRAYPQARYPHGPPPGSVWDRRLHTNFGRAFDRDLLSALRKYCRDVEQGLNPPL